MSDIEIIQRATVYAESYSQVIGSAEISACGTYRYRLARSWGVGRKLVFVMLNPSTADAATDDPTIRKCTSYGRRLGYAGIIVVNVNPYRAMDPKVLPESIPMDVATRNRMYIYQAALEAEAVIVAWGRHESSARLQEVSSALLALMNARRPLYCLKRNKDGSPSHPLYLKGDATLKGWGRL